MRPLFLGYEAVRSFSGDLKRGERVELDTTSLVRHAFVCGTTGSGKTVFAKGIAEEAVLAGVPVIAVDFKFDIASLALHGALAERPALQHLFGEEGAAVHAEFTGGLERHRASVSGASAFAERADVRLFTPNAPIAHRVALAALPSFPDPVSDPLEQSERDELVATLVRGFAVSMYGSESRVKRNEPSVKLLEEIVRYCNQRGERLEGPDGIARVQQLVLAPPFSSIGGLAIDQYVTAKQREVLLLGLNGRVTGAERARYEGPRLSVETLIGGVAPGRVPLSVLYLGHLSDFFDQALLLGQLCADLYRWMRRGGGSRDLKLLLYIDELGGGDNKAAFYPSYPHNPPSKGPLNLLIKQGRSAGVGVLLATQNPMSVDVRGLGNVNTWAIGKLNQRNDQERVRSVLEQMPQGRDRALQELAQMPVGSFLTLSDGLSAPRIVWERWLYSVHRQLSPAVVREIHALQRQYRTDEPRSTEPRPPSEPQRSERDPSEQTREELPHDDLIASFPSSADAAETLTLPLSSAVRWEVRCGERRWSVPASGVTIGRSSSAAIQLDDPHISRQHVELVPDGIELVVRALQTKNPTVVDGRMLQGEARIEAMGPVLLQIGSLELSIEPVFSGSAQTARSFRDG